MSELPKGWTWTTLEEFCYKITDGTHKTPKYVNQGVPFVSTTNINPFKSGFDFSNYQKFITQEEHQQLIKRCYPEIGDILLSKCGTIGRSKLVDVDYQFSVFVGLALLKFYQDKINGKYLELLLNSDQAQKQLEDLSPGSTRKTLAISAIHKFRLPLPPLNEQRRIVAKLEKLLAKVEACKQRLEKIPTILKRFRQSVLAAACSGRLTEDWREQNPDVESAEELFNEFKASKEYRKVRIKDELPIPFDIPTSWQWINLIEGCESLTDGDHQPPPKLNQGIPLLVISNIKDGILDFSNTRYVSEEYYEKIKDSRKPMKGDILYSVVGSYGIPVIVNVDKPFCFQRHIALLRVNKLLLNTYLLYTLKSRMVFDQATFVATGSAQLTVTLTGLRKIKIPLPPLAEQQEIVRRVETLFKKADAIEQRYQKAKAYIDQLTQSILAKAFRGELVPQDLNDESASVLLDRIRQEKEQTEKKTKPRKKSSRKLGDDSEAQQQSLL